MLLAKFIARVSTQPFSNARPRARAVRLDFLPYPETARNPRREPSALSSKPKQLGNFVGRERRRKFSFLHRVLQRRQFRLELGVAAQAFLNSRLDQRPHPAHLLLAAFGVEFAFFREP